MKQQDFIDAIYLAGWRDNSDAQHKGIKALHRKLFPVVAALEDELDDIIYTVNQFNKDD